MHSCGTGNPQTLQLAWNAIDWSWTSEAHALLEARDEATVSMAQAAPAPAANPSPALAGGGLILGPANITVVRTSAQLKRAVVSRARDIEIREHLDLTPLLDDRGPFNDTSTENFYREALIDPLALLLLEEGTRSIRVCLQTA